MIKSRRNTVPSGRGIGSLRPRIPFRKLLSAIALILVLFAVLGCALPGKGKLPEADLPKALPGAGPKPSLSFQIAFFPPGSDKAPKLIEEFVLELESSQFFGTIAQAPAEGDIRMTIVLTQACAISSKTFVLWLATGTLVPVRVPCEYELQAEIHGCSGKKVGYEIRDETSRLVWAPGWPPGVDWGIDPSSSAVRRNLYRTLMVKMHADGLLGQCAQLPR